MTKLTQESLIEILQSEAYLRHALAGIKSMGATVEITYQSTRYLDKLWEHSEITKRNQELGTKGILNAGFYSLYGHYMSGQYILVTGRIGNTTSYLIKFPE